MSAKFKNGITIDGGNIDTASGQVYKINGTTVLSSTQVFGKTVGGISTGDIVDLSTSQTLTSKTLTSPTLTTPTIGVATATSINKVAITAPANSATLTIADGKTLTANNSIQLNGTDSTTMTFPSTSATIARTDAGQTFTGTNTFSGASVTIGTASTTTGTVVLKNSTSTGNTTLTPSNTSATDYTLFIPAANGTVATYSSSVLASAITSSSITKTGLTSAGYVKTDASGNLTSTTATTLETPWSNVAERSGTVSVVNPGGFPVLLGMGLTSSSVSGTTVAGQIFYIDPADYTLTGYTANWRLVVNGLTNANTTIDTTKTPQVTVKTFNNTSTSTAGQTGPSYTGTAYWPCTLPATSPSTAFQVSASTTSFSPSTAKHLVMVLDLPTGAIVTSSMGLNITARLQVKYVQN